MVHGGSDVLVPKEFLHGVKDFGELFEQFFGREN
jgi:hypothetical protein